MHFSGVSHEARRWSLAVKRLNLFPEEEAHDTGFYIVSQVYKKGGTGGGKSHGRLEVKRAMTGMEVGSSDVTFGDCVTSDHQTVKLG